MGSPKWFKRLEEKWEVTPKRLIIILIVFACTGTTIVIIKKPILKAILGGEDPGVLFYILYYIFILPVYNVFLLLYGFLFGQFSWFWNYEKKMLNRMFKRRKK